MCDRDDLFSDINNCQSYVIYNPINIRLMRFTFQGLLSLDIRRKIWHFLYFFGFWGSANTQKVQSALWICNFDRLSCVSWESRKIDKWDMSISFDPKCQYTQYEIHVHNQLVALAMKVGKCYNEMSRPIAILFPPTIQPKYKLFFTSFFTMLISEC